MDLRAIILKIKKMNIKYFYWIRVFIGLFFMYVIMYQNPISIHSKAIMLFGILLYLSFGSDEYLRTVKSHIRDDIDRFVWFAVFSCAYLFLVFLFNNFKF